MLVRARGLLTDLDAMGAVIVQAARLCGKFMLGMLGPSWRQDGTLLVGGALVGGDHETARLPRGALVLVRPSLALVDLGGPLGGHRLDPEAI